MEQALSNQDKAGGEMLNPATSNVSVESIPPEHEKKPEFSALGSAYKQQEAFAETDKWAQGQVEREEAGDAWQNSWSHIGGRIVSGSSDEGGRIVRADDLERENADSILGINQAAYDVNEWMLDRGNEKKAERAAFHFYRTINPDATPDEIAQVWQQGVFGESTKNNASLFASALEQIVGSSRQVLDIARKVERGEMRPEEGMAYLEGKTVDGDKKNAFDVATALNQSAIGNSRELRTFRYLRNVQGLSIQETMMARAISRTARTHSGAIDKTPDMVVAQAKRWGVPSERIPAVVNAAVSVMPEDDAGIFAQTWDNYVSMTNRSFYSAKGAFDRVRIGSIQNSVAESREAKDSLVYNGPDFDMGVISQVVSEAKKQGLGVTHTARGNFVNFKTPQDKERFLSMLESATGVKEEEARIRSVLRQNLAFNYSNPSATARVLGGVGYTVTLAAPILATGGAPAAGIVGSAALGGGVEGLNVADAAFAEGASVERSNVAGLGAAAVSGTLELVGGKILSEAVHGVKLLSGLTRGTGSSASVSALSNSDLATLFAGKEGVKRLLAKGGKLVGTELATESAQTISSEGFRQWAVDGDAWEGIKSGGKEIVDPEFIATVLLSSVLMGGAGKASAALENRRAQDRAYKYLAQNPKTVQFLRDIGALDKDVKIDMEGAASRNDVEAAANAYFRTIVSEKATDQALAAIDKATDQAALNSQGGLTLDNTAFVNAVMSPMPEDSTVYKAEWDVDRKKEFIAGRTGIKKRQVSSDLLRAFDVLSNAVEITAAKLRHASTYAAESRKATDGITLDDVTTAELEGDSTSSAITEKDFRAILRRFIDSDIDMGDADIRGELEDYLSKSKSVTASLQKALDGMYQRAQSPYQVAAALDAFGRSCMPGLRSRTTEKTVYDRLEFFAMNNVGLLQSEIPAYERYQRSRYLSEVQSRASLDSLDASGRKKFTETLSGVFGFPVEVGPVPEWASPSEVQEIEDGAIQGIYRPDRIWISEDAVVGTGLHEAVWHATWRWAKVNSPEVYRQLQEYARNTPRWIREKIASEYDTFDIDLVLEEAGAFVFENEFSADFQKFLDSKNEKAWFDGMKGLFDKAFSMMTKNRTASPREAVRNLYKDFKKGTLRKSSIPRDVEAETRYSRRRMHDWDKEVEISRHAIISAVHTLVAGLPARSVRLAKLPASLNKYDRSCVLSRADALCELVRARFRKKDFTMEEALDAVKDARRDVENRLVYAPIYEEVNVGTDTEILARTTVSEEVDRIRDGRTGYSPRLAISITQEMSELVNVLKHSAGAVAAEERSEQKIQEDALAFGSLLEEISTRMPRSSYNPDEPFDRAAIVLFITDMARDYGLPDDKIAALEDLSSRLGFSHLDVPSRASAYNLVSEVWSVITQIEYAKEHGPSKAKDKAAETKAEQSNMEASNLLRQLDNVYNGMSFDDLVKRTSGTVLIAAYNKLCESFNIDSRIFEKNVASGEETRIVLSKYSDTAAELSSLLKTAKEQMEAGSLLLEERKALNETVKDLQFKLDSFMAAFEHGGAFVQAFKNGIEQLAMKQLGAGASGSVVTKLASFRATQSISEALAQSYSLLSATSKAGSRWKAPFLRARLQSLMGQFREQASQLEKVNDDAAYYTPEYRVFMRALVDMWAKFSEASFDTVATEIDKLTSDKAKQDDHTRAQVRALEYIGGAEYMSAEMLDMAYWRIVAERDTSFVTQRAKVRALKEDVSSMAQPFISALKSNPNYHDASPSKGIAKGVSKAWRFASQYFFSIGDRLAGMVKRASGEEYEAARMWAYNFNRSLDKAAADHDALLSRQEAWSTSIYKRVLGKNWTQRLFDLNNKVVSDSELKNSGRFDHTIDASARLKALTPMQLLHVYMSSKQKAFQAAVMVPGVFSEGDFAKIEARQDYVADCRSGGELDTFIKTFQGGVLHQIAEAWRARWAEVFPQLNEAYRSVYGFDMYDPFGEDNYYPLSRYDKAAPPAVQGGVILPVTRRFQSRTINVNDLNASASFLSVVNEQMDAVLHTIAFAKSHLGVERLWGLQEFAKAMETHVKRADFDGLNRHIWDVLAMPAQKPSTELDFLTSTAAGATAVIALAGNIVSAIQQVFGGATYIGKYDGRLWDGISAATYVMHSPQQWYEDVKRLFSEPEVKARWNEYERALNLAAAGGRISNTKKFLRKLKDYSLWMINRGDMVPAITAGVGFYRLAYNKALAEGKTHERAHRDAMYEFIYLTETSQQTRRDANMWSLQRTRLGRAFTQFTTMNDQALGNNLRAWSDLFGAGVTGLKDGVRWKRWAKSTLAHGLLFAAFTEFMVDLVQRVLFEKLDDDEEFWDLDWKAYAQAAALSGAYRSTPYRVAEDTLSTDWSAANNPLSDLPMVSVPVNFVRKVCRAVGDTYYFAIDENPKKPGYPSKKTVEDIFRQWMKISPAGKQILDFCDKQFGEDESEMNYPH